MWEKVGKCRTDYFADWCFRGTGRQKTLKWRYDIDRKVWRKADKLFLNAQRSQHKTQKLVRHPWSADRFLSQALSSHCMPGPAACWPSFQGSGGPKHRWWVAWFATAMRSDSSLLSFHAASPVLSTCPNIFKDLTWTWQIGSWFTLMFWYNTWGISVALEKCSKKLCRFSKGLRIANNLKAVRNPTFSWSLGARTISVYFEPCQGAASAFHSVL